MNNSEHKNASTSFGFFDALQILFIAFKLTGIIDWSWSWVLTPIWGGVLVAILSYMILSLLSDR